MATNQHAPRPLASVLADVPGKWVAVDRDSGELVAVADTAYALIAEINRRGLTEVGIVRAPDPSEPELVGLG